MIGSFRGLVMLSASGLALALLPAVGPSASALSIAPRYASPNGSVSATCAQDDPCDLAVAVNGASGGGSVYLAGGNYYQASPTTTVLQDQGNITITGPSSGQPAVIYSAAPYGFHLFYTSSLSHVVLIYSGGTLGLLTLRAPVDHVAVFATAGGACATYVSLVDSVCETSSNAANAVDLYSDGAGSGSFVTTYTPLVRNVTAIATGIGDYGISLHSGDSVAINASIVNTIAKGSAADLHTALNDETSTHSGDVMPAVSATVSHSDFATEYTEDNSGETTPTDTITTASTDISGTPKFSHSSTSYYSEAAGSPTINRGARVSGTDTDLAGWRRTLGSTTDIGAYERPQAPALGKVRVTGKTRKTISGRVAVNGEGYGITAYLMVSRNGHRVALVKDAHHGVGSATFTFRVRGLKPRHTYRLQAVASNAVGAVKTTKLSVKTRT